MSFTNSVPTSRCPAAGSVPSGRNLRNTRFWVLLDQLLTQPSVVEAKAASDVLRG